MSGFFRPAVLLLLVAAVVATSASEGEVIPLRMMLKRSVNFTPSWGKRSLPSGSPSSSSSSGLAWQRLSANLLSAKERCTVDAANRLEQVAKLVEVRKWSVTNFKRMDFQSQSHQFDDIARNPSPSKFGLKSYFLTLSNDIFVEFS